ncbi:hypothetical protein [Desulfosporosinus sp.]|uniref:hypothetical protein n=1 Tax=Desulfosporosinus sp. TaxID=157907 RepID=UPI0025C2CBD4|nr:hypothetical protein [Desulfosporosinus sp.]MBC2727056.1 hypothetical protein [Desulfosporosinus sp.]
MGQQVAMVSKIVGKHKYGLCIWGDNVQKVTAICYFFTLLFYGMGYFKTLVIRTTVPEHITTYDYTISISMATVYFVLAILFAVIGSLFLYVKSNREMTSDRREKPS